MNDRSQKPLIRSSVLLRGVATAITLTSLGGMTSFAATHLQNTAAPLQPSAAATTTTRRSTTITGTTTTTTTARTKTRSS